MTPYARIVDGMTQTMKHQMLGWRRRAGLAALGAASEVAGHATVTAADTIVTSAVLAEGVSKTLESV